MAITLTVGNSYTLGGFDWICAEISGNCATLQSKGMTAGTWPAYKLTSDYEGTTSFGAADTFYTSDIDGLNIANYDAFTSAFYEAYKSVEYQNASYGKGLFLANRQMCDPTLGGYGSGNYFDGHVAAGTNCANFGGTAAVSWLSTYSATDLAFYVVSDGRVIANSYARQDAYGSGRAYVLAPAFNLDTSNSKLVLDGSDITTMQYVPTKIYIGDSNGEAKLIEEGTPVELVSWANGTDEQIAAMINAFYNDELTLNDIKSVWTVGDTRTISLSAMAATGVGESHRAQNVKIQILDFEHDNLTTAINGHTKALLTVDLKDCLMDAACEAGTAYGSQNTENGYMNSSITNVGGWKDSARRTWCNNVFYNALPSGFKSLVKQVQKVTSQGNKLTTTDTTTDYCYLLSEYEIFGTITYSAVQEGEQYALYANAATNRYKMPKWNSSFVSDVWWERSPRGSRTGDFCAVNGGGNATGYSASVARGLAPAMCI